MLALLSIPLTGHKGVGAFAIALLGAGTLNVTIEALGLFGGARVSAQVLNGGVGLLEIAVAAFLLQRVHVEAIVIIGPLVFLASFLWFQSRAFLLRHKSEQADVVRGELDGA